MDIEKERKRFKKLTYPIRIGVKDVIYEYDSWQHSVPLLCEEFGLKYIEFINHKNEKEYFICKDDDAVSRVEDSGIILILSTGRLKEEGRYLLGTLLDYPPKACKEFSKMNFNDDENIAVNYCGIGFRSFKDTVLDDILWLFENRKPDKVKNIRLTVTGTVNKGYRISTEVSLRGPISTDEVIQILKNEILILFERQKD